MYTKAKNHCPEGYKCIEIQKVCKRATSLHTEQCTQTATSYYCSGAGYTATGSKGTTTITYGSLGNSGTLTAGDAFDCDVNGDGTYSPATERFYYVADQGTDTAVIAQLPTPAQWKNVSLKNTIRDLTDVLGAVKKVGFSYAGYAARLLTTQELESACGITVGSATFGELDSCNYLMENTYYSKSYLNFGTWLENPASDDYGYAWIGVGAGRTAGHEYVGFARGFGVRPAIEILKSDVLY